MPRMSPDEIKATLAQLRGRSWPTSDTNTPSSPHWSDRYVLNPCLSEEDVAAFEVRYRVTLPREYRTFLTQVGNGGAGPSFGLFPLGTYGDQALEADILDGLHVPFDEDAAEDREGEDDPLDWDEVMYGGMIIATEGCARWFWLIVSGPNAGEIWFDARPDGEAPECVVGEMGPLSFWEWYEEWLVGCAQPVVF